MVGRAHRIGLTGSIGMGKSTTAAMFAEAGVPVWDADAAVARLYGVAGAAVAPLRAICPDAVTRGAVDREALRRLIDRNPGLLSQIESVVHPLVAADRAAFLRRAEAEGEPLVVFDIPLLFETGAEGGVDTVVVVSAPAEVQKTRVLARPGMTESRFAAILARQMPDSEKRERADVIIQTTSVEDARRAVQNLIEELRTGN